MPPKKGNKGGKSKSEAPSEPEHDATWEKAVETGVWERPVTALPDAGTWPTWGALRERVLTACKEIKVTQSPTVRDAFVSEIVKLSPPGLKLLDLKAAQNLHKVVLSPISSCPQLEALDLALCPSLEYVLLQSSSITRLDLHHCTALGKALLHCPKLQQLRLSNCPALETLMIWSDELKELDLTGCTGLVTLKLHCPKLATSTIPPLKPAPAPARLAHPPLAALLKESCKELASAAASAKEQQWQTLNHDSTVIPAAYRPLA